MPYIIASDLTDAAVSAAVEALRAQYPNANIADFNQTEEWPGATPGQTLFLVGHGSGADFEDYGNPKDLFREHSQVQVIFNQLDRVALVSCSTASEAGTLEDNGGFQAATFAKNLSSQNPEKTVYAAVGPVYTDEFGRVVVKTEFNAEGITSEDGWKSYENGGERNNDSNPFDDAI